MCIFVSCHTLSSTMWRNFALTSRNNTFKVVNLRAAPNIQTTGRDATVEHILIIVTLLSSATTSSSLFWSKMNYLCIAHAAALWKRQWTLMVEKWKQQKISCFVAGPPSVNLIIFFVHIAFTVAVAVYANLTHASAHSLCSRDRRSHWCRGRRCKHIYYRRELRRETRRTRGNCKMVRNELTFRPFCCDLFGQVRHACVWQFVLWF